MSGWGYGFHFSQVYIPCDKTFFLVGKNLTFWPWPLDFDMHLRKFISRHKLPYWDIRVSQTHMLLELYLFWKRMGGGSAWIMEKKYHYMFFPLTHGHYAISSFAACSKIYHAKNIPLLDGVNTQMVEQNNSKLRKLKSQLSYMNHQNFMSHLKFFLWHCNKRVLDKKWCSAESDCSGQEWNFNDSRIYFQLPYFHLARYYIYSSKLKS